MKEYISPELELIRFSAEDVICSSMNRGTNETPIVEFSSGKSDQAVSPF